MNDDDHRTTADCKRGSRVREMMKPYPNYRQREVLQLLMSGDWMPLLKLIAIGDRLLRNLVQAGWIEQSPDFKTGDLYRITEAGRAAIGHLSR